MEMKTEEKKDYRKHIESSYLKTIDPLSVGDSVRVGIQIVEGNKERTQYYEGIIISRKNGGINRTITVRRISQGVGIERVFLINSPRVVSIEKKKSSKVRRSKLYFLRGLKGKTTKLKEKY